MNLFLERERKREFLKRFSVNNCPLNTKSLLIFTMFWKTFSGYQRVTTSISSIKVYCQENNIDRKAFRHFPWISELSKYRSHGSAVYSKLVALKKKICSKRILCSEAC